MFYTFQGTTRVLMTRDLTNLAPSQLVNNQTFKHLSYFVIMVYIIVLSKSIQEILHAATFSPVDQIH